MVLYAIVKRDPQSMKCRFAPVKHVGLCIGFLEGAGYKVSSRGKWVEEDWHAYKVRTPRGKRLIVYFKTVPADDWQKHFDNAPFGRK